MRYLFFDIECANCNNGLGKMCSFGYVICDTEFNVIKKEDILINPDAKFSYGIYCNKYITLGYPLEEFINKPKFDYFYPKIKEILTYPDQIVIGHAINNDVNFLLCEYERYNLPILKYDFFDSQELYRILTKDTQHKRLATICEELAIEIGVEHRSDEDALMTCQIMEKICENNATTLPELFENNPTSGHKMESAIARYDKRKTLLLFTEFVKSVCPQHKQHRTNEDIMGKTFCFSRKLEVVDFPKMAQLIQIVVDVGGYYTSKVEKCDYFVRSRNRCDKLHKAKEIVKNNENKLQIISFTDFQKMSKIKWSTLPEMDMQEILKNKRNK
ncbi:MAG: exonuclease domain-containing protein [Clostridia bacterium]